VDENWARLEALLLLPESFGFNWFQFPPSSTSFFSIVIPISIKKGFSCLFPSVQSRPPSSWPWISKFQIPISRFPLARNNGSSRLLEEEEPVCPFHPMPPGSFGHLLGRAERTVRYQADHAGEGKEETRRMHPVHLTLSLFLSPRTELISSRHKFFHCCLNIEHHPPKLGSCSEETCFP